MPARDGNVPAEGRAAPQAAPAAAHQETRPLNALKKCEMLIQLEKSREDAIVLFDGGFFKGGFTNAILKAFPRARSVGFEPDPDTFAAARDRFSGDDRVEVINAALSNEAGTRDFFRGPAPATNSILERPTEGNPYYPAHATLEKHAEVQVTTVDICAAERGIDVIDVLKLDLQGAEEKALEGSADLLEGGRASVILCEVAFVEKYKDQPMFWRIWQKLDAYGYSFHSFDEIQIGPYGKVPDGIRKHQWNQADALFISPRLRRVMDA
jgi:FkbM family methyltransferase